MDDQQQIPPTVSEQVPEMQGQSTFRWTRVLKVLGIIFGILVLAYVGVFAWSRYTHPDLGQPGVEIDSYSPTPDPTVDWRTYRNDQYGFEFKYPGEWQMQETGLKTLVPYVTLSKINLDIQHPENINSYWVNVHIRPLQNDISFGVFDTIKIGSILHDRIYLEGSNYIYEITFPVVSDSEVFNPIMNNAIVRQILATFKFVEKSLEGQFCGGIAAIQCPEGYTCKLDGDYPDAGGKCVK